MNDFTALGRNARLAAHAAAADSPGASEDANFRALVEGSLQGIIIHRDWRILFANRAAAQTLGYDTVDELVSVESLIRLIPDDDRARIEGFRNARLKGKPAPERYRTRLLRKDGTSLWVDLLASVLEWQGERALQASFVDISDSVRAKQMLSESEERYALAMQGANVGMWDWQIETDSLFVSATVWRYLGMPVLDKTVSSDVWVERIHPDDRADNQAAVIAHLRGETEYFQIEHRVRVSDGAYRWFHVHALALRRNDGRAYRLAGSVQDITLRKQNEQAMSERLRFEALLTKVSSEFIALPPSEIDAAIGRTLDTIGRFLEVDRGWFLKTGENPRGLEYIHEWCAEGIAPEWIDEEKTYFPAERYPWYWNQLLSGEPVVICSPDDVPPEANEERAYGIEHGVESLLAVPVGLGGTIIGRLGFETIGRQRTWSESVISQLRLVAQVFANAVLRKQTDAALRESEEWLRTFMDNTPALMTLKSLDNRYLLVNRAFEEFVGSSNTQTVGATPSQLLTAEHVRALAEHEREVLEANEAATKVHDLIHVDGSRYCRSVTKFPVYDANEKLVGVGCYSVDITALKEAEEALHERESLLSAISENMPAALFRRVLHPDGRLEFPFLSDSLHRVVGLERDAVVDDAQVLVDAFHPADRTRWIEALHESADTLNVFNIDVRVDNPRGGTTWLRSTARPQRLDDGSVAWDGLALDVTDEKNAGEALRESEERFRNLVEGSLQGIAIVDTDHDLLFANNAYSAMFGYRNTEEIQKLGSHLKLYAPGDRQRVRNFGEARLRGDSIPVAYELDGIRKDGRIVHIVTTMRLIAWKGRPAFQITATDITERKRTEARLQDYQQQLRRLASEISLAEEKERRRIASELHDGAIQNLALAKIKLGELEKSQDQGKRGASLDEIRELLELSIHDARSLIFELSPPVLYELGLAAAVEWLGEQFQTRYRIACRVVAEQGNVPLQVDFEVVLFQVLRELLVNVVKHANATRVEITLRRMGERLAMQVNDDGDGFDAAAVVSGSGGGFGLFNIRERLQLLGATFEIESGPGTRVTVTAPLATEALKERS